MGGGASRAPHAPTHWATYGSTPHGTSAHGTASHTGHGAAHPCPSEAHGPVADTCVATPGHRGGDGGRGGGSGGHGHASGGVHARGTVSQAAGAQAVRERGR